jgi:hypothetical protein
MSKIHWELLDQYKRIRSGEEEVEEDKAITRQELIKDWKEKIYPCIEKDELAPIIEKMKKLRHEYLHLMKEYHETLEHYRKEIRELQRVDPFTNPFIFHELHTPNHNRNLPLITRGHINYIQNTKELPEDL